MVETDIKEHPAYQYNELALLHAPLICLAAGAAVFLLEPPQTRIVVSVGCAFLSGLCYVLGRFVLPVITTVRQLNLMIIGYHFAIFFTLLTDLWFSSGQRAPVGLACVIVTSGMLSTSRFGFFATAVFGSVGWLWLKYDLVGELHPREPIQLLIFAPLVALVIRRSIGRTYSALQTTRQRERRTVEQLQDAMQQLETETRRRQRSEMQLLHARKTESLGILATGVAHDFNNSLLAISAFAENIRATSLEPHTRGDAENIVTAVQQASEICRQMLTYAGRTSDQFTEVDLSQLAQKTLPLLKATTEPSVIVKLNCQTDMAVIRGNATQLQQVMMNLVKNGSEATNGVGKVEVLISREELTKDPSSIPDGSFGAPLLSGTYYVLQVADDGCGMSDETKLQMFDPYFTTKASGHGFGLSTVLGIVRSHKATIRVDSVPQKGTSVTLLFPAYGAPVADSSQFRIPPSNVADDEASNTILVIDDEDLVRTPMAEMLRLMEWDVAEVGGGREAVEMVQSGQTFSVIMIDYKMPKMNGLETLRALREAGCESPAILCSGYISEPEQETVLSEFNGFLPKPFRRQQLEEQLRVVAK